MKKKIILSILIVIGSVTTALVVLGLLFDKEEFEKQQGRTNIYDISSHGSIAYVFYEDGHPGIYLHDGPSIDPIVQLGINKEILDISFSPDGNSLAYIAGYKDKREEISSAIHEVNVVTKENQLFLEEETLMTDIEYDPTNSEQIYYLKANTFENYSPIASARPHDYDLFSYNASTKETVQHTNLKKYMMRSLNVSTDEKAYVVMDDDSQVDSADDFSMTRQRIFEIILDGTNTVQVVDAIDWNKDIYDFFAYDGSFVFQSVNQTGEDGIFEYELFHYSPEAGKVELLTNLGEHSSNPVLHSEDQSIYFMVDKQFGRKNPDYHLYKMDIDGRNMEEIVLYHN